MADAMMSHKVLNVLTQVATPVSLETGKHSLVGRQSVALHWHPGYKASLQCKPFVAAKRNETGPWNPSHFMQRRSPTWSRDGRISTQRPTLIHP